ncbi:MAG TPA: hypothetical protein DDY41_14375 [Arthrobacter bacterium]|nr:hypothetical protein [Arthrobacter sp.]
MEVLLRVLITEFDEQLDETSGGFLGHAASAHGEHHQLLSVGGLVERNIRAPVRKGRRFTGFDVSVFVLYRFDELFQGLSPMLLSPEWRILPP